MKVQTYVFCSFLCIAFNESILHGGGPASDFIFIKARDCFWLHLQCSTVETVLTVTALVDLV